MTAITSRPSAFGENGLSEPDQDANSTLTELDKGLRSGKIGEQCEAIVRFPRLFEKYPFPILINSACLKLGEVFRVGTNFLRVLVLKVMQQSEKHLDKILNVDEFVRRIYCVIYSNDPMARALTLRTLGSIAAIVAERKNVHHSIRTSLDSHDLVELEAAIYAAGCLAAQSKTFASNICTKIGEMIQGLATPVNVKLKLLAVFQNMHHDGQTAAIVRKLCVDLLPSYPSQQFVVVTLHTLTQLASVLLTDIPDQVNLLLNYIKKDPRGGVKIHALKDLKLLAEKGPHLWSRQNVEDMVTYSLETPYLNLRCQALPVLLMLAKSVAVDKFDLYKGCKVLQLCSECVFHSNIILASLSVELLTQFAIHAHKEELAVEKPGLTQEACSGIETLLLVICSQEKSTSEETAVLKSALKCAVNLCEANTDLCSQFVDCIGSLMVNGTESTIVPLAEALCAIGSHRAGVLAHLQQELLLLAENLSDQSKERSEHSQSLVLICTLIFQSGINRHWVPQDRMAIMKSVEKLDLWLVYRIARQAARYGYHQIASELFSRLCNRVNTEHFHFWLVALWEISLAESCLQDVGDERGSCSKLAKGSDMSQAITHYLKAVSALKAATTPLYNLQFQYEYTVLRSQVLQAHNQLVHACSCLWTSPPSAIAASVAMTSRDELQNCGRIVVELRKCAKDFRALADKYGSLYQSVFNADRTTLTTIQIQQQCCLLMVQAIERVAQYNQGMGANDVKMLHMDQSQKSLENYKVKEAYRRIVSVIRTLGEDSEVRTIGGKEIDGLKKISEELIRVPLSVPRYFFQTLQSTVIKLAVSPQPKAPGEPNDIIQNTAHLAVKVEGVVQHGGRPILFRQITKVLLTVSSTLQSKATTVQEGKVQQDNNNTMSQTVKPHNDYFHAQFLLAFPVVGLHQVMIEAAVVDETEAHWTTGPKTTLLVKSYDDTSNQKQTSRVFGQRF